jgi:hypothetical protein
MGDTTDTPAAYLESLEEPRRSEVERLDRLIRESVPALEPHVRSGMLAYGPYHYRYASGREGESALISLASRKAHLSLYVQCSVDGRYVAERYAERLPKATIGKSCVRFKRLADVDEAVLAELLAEAERVGPEAAVEAPR